MERRGNGDKNGVSRITYFLINANSSVQGTRAICMLVQFFRYNHVGVLPYILTLFDYIVRRVSASVSRARRCRPVQFRLHSPPRRVQMRIVNFTSFIIEKISLSPFHTMKFLKTSRHKYSRTHAQFSHPGRKHMYLPTYRFKIMENDH